MNSFSVFYRLPYYSLNFCLRYNFLIYLELQAISQFLYTVFVF